MPFFPEIDVEKTIQNAKRKLREYHVWIEIANDWEGQKVTASYSLELKTPLMSPSKAVEKLAIKKGDAQTEADNIKYAFNHINDPLSRIIIRERFFCVPPKATQILADELHMSRETLNNEINRACLTFAAIYRNGALMVEI